MSDVDRRAKRRGARAVLHEHRPPGLRARQPAGNGEGRAVRALLAIAEVAAAAVSRRVLRRGRAAAASRRPATGVGAERAERLYQRVFNEYGDDSVAQLGGVHLAVEDASNILTKVLERGRLMAYLEQSTRYIPYTERRGDAWRYLVPAELDGHPLRAQYVATLNAAFEIYAQWIDPMRAWFEAPLSEGGRRFRRRVSRGDPRQGARHAARPAAGGDAVERRHVRHGPGVRDAAAADARASARRSARDRRRDAARAAQGHPGVSDARRSARSRRPLERVPRRHARRARPSVAGAHRTRRRRRRAGRRSDADGFRSRRRNQSRRRRAVRRRRRCPTRSCSTSARAHDAPPSAPRCCAPTSAIAPTGATSPGRAFERTSYRFDILTDYGAFRDLQRHRLLTIDWQSLSRAPRLHRSRRRSSKPAATPTGARSWIDRPSCTTRCVGAGLAGCRAICRVDGLSGPLRHGHERARGDARDRAPHGAAGPPGVPPRLPADAHADRRRRRPSRDRRGDAVRRSLAVELERLQEERQAGAETQGE